MNERIGNSLCKLSFLHDTEQFVARFVNSKDNVEVASSVLHERTSERIGEQVEKTPAPQDAEQSSTRFVL